MYAGYSCILAWVVCHPFIQNWALLIRSLLILTVSASDTEIYSVYNGY